MTPTPTPDAIMQLGTGYWSSKTLLSAVELGLFTELAVEGELDADALRERLALHPRGARDFFDALVALGMLDRRDGRYRNTPAGETFLDRAKSSYVGGLLEMLSIRSYPVWASLTDALRNGEPQSGAEDGAGAQRARPAAATSATKRRRRSTGAGIRRCRDAWRLVRMLSPTRLLTTRSGSSPSSCTPTRRILDAAASSSATTGRPSGHD